jgi:hypothetical protein
MANLEHTLVNTAELIEQVQNIVETCQSVGVRITNPRRLRLERRRLDPFMGLAHLTGDEANDLLGVLDEMEHPDLVAEALEMAGITGKILGKLKQLGKAKDDLVVAAMKRAEEEV